MQAEATNTYHGAEPYMPAAVSPLASLLLEAARLHTHTDSSPTPSNSIATGRLKSGRRFSSRKPHPDEPPYSCTRLQQGGSRAIE